MDRYYIERFLDEERAAIRGRVLEVGERTYTERFGGAAVETSDVLHVDAGAPGATIVGDLRGIPSVQDNVFDCIILTQTLHFVYAMEAAVSELHRILVPGGSVLCTVPGISQVSRFDMDRWGDYWRLTDLSARELFATAFDTRAISVRTYGNVLSATALLHGLACAELTDEELHARDPNYPVCVAIKATKVAP